MGYVFIMTSHCRTW